MLLFHLVVFYLPISTSVLLCHWMDSRHLCIVFYPTMIILGFLRVVFVSLFCSVCMHIMKSRKYVLLFSPGVSWLSKCFTRPRLFCFLSRLFFLLSQFIVRPFTKACIACAYNILTRGGKTIDSNEIEMPLPNAETTIKTQQTKYQLNGPIRRVAEWPTGQTSAVT